MKSTVGVACTVQARGGSSRSSERPHTRPTPPEQPVSMETGCHKEESPTYPEEEVIKVMIPFEPLTGSGRPFTFLLWRRLTEEELLAFLQFHRASPPVVQDALRQYRRRRRQAGTRSGTQLAAPPAGTRVKKTLSDSGTPKLTGSARYLGTTKRELGDGAHLSPRVISGEPGATVAPEGTHPGKSLAKTVLPRTNPSDAPCPPCSILPGMVSKD